MKLCPRCGQFKSLEAFARNRRHRTGRQTYCRGCHSTISREIRRRNPEKMRLKRQRDSAWRKAKDRDKRLTSVERTALRPIRNAERLRRWKAANPERWAEHQRTACKTRRARLAGARGRASAAARRARWAYYGGRCWMCGGAATDMDHVIPLSKGGADWPSNLRPACRSCNARKHNRIPQAA